MASETNYVELIKPLNYILEVSEKYSHLWEDATNLDGKPLEFFYDSDSSTIHVQKFREKFSFGGTNLNNIVNKNQLNAIEAAEELGTWSLEDAITPESLLENFYSALKKPLERDLTEIELNRLRDTYAGRS